MPTPTEFNSSTDLEPIITRALELYCHFANAWVDPDQHTYTPGDFTASDVGYCRIAHYSDDLLMLHISDGDEGGPTVLYAMLDSFLKDATIIGLSSIFDLQLTHIWASNNDGGDGQFICLPDNDYRA